MKTDNWPSILDSLIYDAFLSGRVRGVVSGVPSKVIESGLAHIFFYGNTVFKLYKTHDDKDHFIKGVLAPTKRRTQFLNHDYLLNNHFSKSVYLNRYSLDYVNGEVSTKKYDGHSIYTLVEMNVLDFNQNLHEQLLRKEVQEKDLYTLGYETAKAVDTYPGKAAAHVNWFDVARERVRLLRQFIDWLPDEFGDPVKESLVIESLETHLEKYKEEYTAISGEQLVVNLDNHDENVFFIDGKPCFIDLLPPMDSWWYGLPHANLSNIMANIEVLHSDVAAQQVKDGYLEYHQLSGLLVHSFGFTHAFAYLISIAHFGSSPGKEEVAHLYLKRLNEIQSWL